VAKCCSRSRSAGTRFDLILVVVVIILSISQSGNRFKSLEILPAGRFELSGCWLRPPSRCGSGANWIRGSSLLGGSCPAVVAFSSTVGDLSIVSSESNLSSGVDRYSLEIDLPI
jgi:hypothetical protein